MSLSSKMRKQKGESYAAQAMHSSIGLPSSRGFDHDLIANLPSHSSSDSHPNAIADYEKVIDLIAAVNDAKAAENNSESAQ